MTCRPRQLHHADRLVMKALEIVNYFQPDLWFLENPRKGLLRTREYMKGLPYVDIDYCQVSDWGYQKPTRFWGSAVLGQLPSLTCDSRTCPNLHRRPNGWMGHKKILGGTPEPGVERVALYDQYRVPPKAVYYLVNGNCTIPPRQAMPQMATESTLTRGILEPVIPKGGGARPDSPPSRGRPASPPLGPGWSSPPLGRNSWTTATPNANCLLLDLTWNTQSIICEQSTSTPWKKGYGLSTRRMDLMKA